MRMKPVLFAGVLLVGAGAVGGYYYMQSSARALWVAGLAEYQKGLPTGSTLTYGTLTVSGFGRSAEITDIMLEMPVKFGMIDTKTSVKIAKATINDVGGSADVPKIGHLVLSDIKSTDGSFMTNEVVLDNVAIFPGLKNNAQLDLKKINMDLFKIGDFSYKLNNTEFLLKEISVKNLKDGYIDNFSFKNLSTKFDFTGKDPVSVIYDECTYIHLPIANWAQLKFIGYSFKSSECKGFEEKTKDFSAKFKSIKTQNTEEDAQGRLKHLKVVGEKLSINILNKPPQFNMLMQKVGHQDLDGAFNLDFEVDHDKGDFGLNVTLSFDDIGDYGFGFNLTGLKLTEYMTAIMPYYAAMIEGRKPDVAILLPGILSSMKDTAFSSADFSYTDKGLLKTALGMAGPAMPPEQLAKQVAAGAAASLGSSGLNDLAADWGPKLESFITKPGKISLHIAPEKPFGMAEGMALAAKQVKPADIVTLMRPVLTVEQGQ